MFNDFKARMNRTGKSQGDAYLRNADIAIDKTFKRDASYREVIVTHIPSNINHEKYDAKFSIHTRRSITGDAEDYFLTFRPHVRVPIGAYVDIPDDEGVLQTWLVVLKDDKPQFPMYYVLKCNWTLKWVVGNKVYKVLGCLRNQNSYNSGLWTDYTFTTVENQNKFWMPTTPYTQTIEYGQRFVINDPGRTIPIVWKCSKVEDVQPLGLTRLTLAQEVANLQEDCSKYALAGWCSCEDKSMERPEACKMCTLEEPICIDAALEMPEEEPFVGRIVYAGKTPALRVGGQDKFFTSEFWDSDSGKFVSEEATWKASFMKADTTLCVVNFNYNIDQGWEVALADDSPQVILNVIQEDNVCNIKCSSNNEEILNFYASPSNENPHSINIRCSRLYAMVGKTIVLSSYNKNNNYTEEIALEVIS